MDIKEYIASGIIESFVLGSVTDQERREVECLSSIYPEVREEILRYQKAVEQLASEAAIPTSDETKQKVLSALYSEIDRDLKGVSDAPIIQGDFTGKTASSFKWKYLAAASFVLFLIATTVFLRANLRNSEMVSQLQDMETDYALQTKTLKEELAAVSQEREENLAQINLLSNASTRFIPLNGSAISESSNVSVYWNTDEEKAVVKINNLPAAPSQMQYQFWAIVDGTPVDMGVLPVDLNVNELYTLEVAVNAQAFAITLEELGGKPTPNLDQLYVIGNV